MTQSIDQDAEAVKDQLDRLQEALEIASENGLLNDNSNTYEKILNCIVRGLQELSENPPKTIDARKTFSLAHHQFNQVIDSTSFWWRFKYSFGGPVLLYLIPLLAILSLTWVLFSSVISGLEILWVPGWAFLWGMIGGILQGFWWLWQHVNYRILRKFWLTWYFLLPLMGAILGSLTYLIFFAGFIAATGETQITSQFFVMLLSALAGFSSRWAVQMLDKLTTIIKVSG